MLNPISFPTLPETVIHRATVLRSAALDAPTPTSLARAALLRLLATFSAWQERASQRRALLDLTDRQLSDIGIDRRMAQREAAKHFWQA